MKNRFYQWTACPVAPGSLAIVSQLADDQYSDHINVWFWFFSDDIVKCFPWTRPKCIIILSGVRIPVTDAELEPTLTNSVKNVCDDMACQLPNSLSTQIHEMINGKGALCVDVNTCLNIEHLSKHWAPV